MNLIKSWLVKRKMKKDETFYGMLADYEILVRLARRCAYDLCHVVGDLREDSYYATYMEARARRWADLFAKGNPGKDYRNDIVMQLGEREDFIIDLIEYGIAHKDEIPAELYSKLVNNDPRLPF